MTYSKLTAHSCLRAAASNLMRSSRVFTVLIVSIGPPLFQAADGHYSLSFPRKGSPACLAFRGEKNQDLSLDGPPRGVIDAPGGPWDSDRGRSLMATAIASKEAVPRL